MVYIAQDKVLAARKNLVHDDRVASRDIIVPQKSPSVVYSSCAMSNPYQVQVDLKKQANSRIKYQSTNLVFL